LILTVLLGGRREPAFEKIERTVDWNWDVPLVVRCHRISERRTLLAQQWPAPSKLLSARKVLRPAGRMGAARVVKHAITPSLGMIRSSTTTTLPLPLHDKTRATPTTTMMTTQEMTPTIPTLWM